MENQILKDNKLINSIKHIIISFFVLVFIMGYFSRTFINLTLPKVQTVTAKNNTSIDKTVEVVGEIKPKISFKARSDRNIIVEEYFIKPGDEVKTGMPLFRINQSYGGKGNDELIDDLNEQIREYEIELQRLQKVPISKKEQNIKLLNDKIESASKDKEDNEVLYQAGAISKADYENSMLQIEESIFNLEASVMQLEAEIEAHYYEIDEIQHDINELREEISDLREQQKLYIHIDKDGIYYAESNGVILSINSTNTVIVKDTPIIEIAKVDGFESVKFVAHINKEQYDIVKEVRNIEVINTDMTKSVIAITNLSMVANGSMIELEGEFINEFKGELIINERVKGNVVKSYEAGENYCIPKTAIIPTTELREGYEGKVYVIEENDNVLGKELIAIEAKVDIIAVGDDRVIVSGLQKYRDPKLVNNLSYKIQDGVRVRS